MKTQIQQGDALYVTAPGGGMTSGNGYLIGSVFGIAAFTASAGVTNAVIYIRGAFVIAKVSAQAWTQGQLIYWDNVAFNCTTVSTSNHPIGVALNIAGNPSATGQVLLLPSAIT
jgi:predicted RecA/RadA family phage recombinase